MANDACSGVGNSSAQTVDAHVPREWEEPASEALREGWSEAEVCAEEVAAPLEPVRGRFSAGAGDTIERQLPAGKAQSTIGKQLHSAKQGTIGTSNLRTSSIGKSTFCQIMVPNGQVLRG